MGAQNPFLSNNPTPDLFVSEAKDSDTVLLITDTLKKKVQESYPDLEKLIGAVESLGIPVVSNAPVLQLKLALFLVGVKPGLVVPSHPRYTMLIETLQKNMPEKAHLDFSDGVIILTPDTKQFTFLAYQFYHACGLKRGMKGYHYRALEMLEMFHNKYGGTLPPAWLDTLTLDETAMLKAAVRRDREALQFVRQLLSEVYIPTNNSQLLDQKGHAQA